METYGSRLRGVVRSVVDRVLGRDVATCRETVSYDEARRLLETVDEVRVTRIPSGIAPATTHTLNGATVATAWTHLTEGYTVEEPVLETMCRGDVCTYEVRTQYEKDGLYSGEYRFHVDGDAR